MTSITGEQHLGSKLLIFAALLISLWNLFKLPYYIQFDANGDSLYEKGGLAVSINLCFWTNGLYEGSRLRDPACNFVLVHATFAITLLVMVALSLMKTAWQRKYGNYFFALALVLAVHAFPSSLTQVVAFKKCNAVITCLVYFVTAIWGFKTLRDYDTDPAKAEKHLQIQYNVIAFFLYVFGLLEFPIVAANLVYYFKNGVMEKFGETPDPLFGHTIYDKLPEKVGMTFFFVFITVVWLWWPAKIVEVDTNVGTNKSDVTAGETTSLKYDSISA
eukprot:CAMPEP_0201690652 /NCGR_PEP_ID=MMETSP0578-20130828/4043_1 /ASSEMBLY_ACC=CAM_ASM_000663 /TAXON_ID=267565 /ORGANISM="Skeletonema grethea, Strain CCMP 1804" /LENGTH=273 /DNA_ID=CAMNT_0048175697 /DNA_START=82 /DNA_END=903 /DNA_ORIENTATION=-